jgi:tetratricopeptide (TPR) repeat protein
MNHRIIHALCAMRIYMIAILLSGISGQLLANDDQRNTFFALIDSAKGMQQQMPDSALVIVKEAYQISTAIGDDSLNMIAYRSFAGIYFEVGNHHLALDYFFRTLQIVESTPKENMNEQQLYNLLFLYSRIGNCYFELGVTELSKEYFSQSLTLINDTEERMPGTFSEFSHIAILFNVGSFYLEEKDLKKAREYFDEVELLNRSLNDTMVHITYLMNMGIYYKEKNMLDRSIDNYQKALYYAKKLNQTGYTIQVLNNLGEASRIQGRLDEAIAYFSDALKLGRELPAWRSVIISAKGLAQLYEEMNDYQMAYNMSWLVNNINDSIFSHERSERYTRMALQYDFDKALMDTHLNQQFIEKRIKNRTLSLLLISSLFLLFVITSILIIINLRRKAEIERLRQVYVTQQGQHLEKEKEEIVLELDGKNRALAEKAIYLIKKNELISDIAKKLMILSQDMPEHCSTQLEQVIKSLRSDTDQQFWKEFQLRFNDVHQDFHQALNTKFPDLSPAERKLAAFIHLNLTTKEIAAITYRAPESIKVARTRLRKKLGLTTEENLVSFLNNL